MKRLIMGVLAGVFMLGLNASVVLAYRCPKLVGECNA